MQEEFDRQAKQVDFKIPDYAHERMPAPPATRPRPGPPAAGTAAATRHTAGRAGAGESFDAGSPGPRPPCMMGGTCCRAGSAAVSDLRRSYDLAGVAER